VRTRISKTAEEEEEEEEEEDGRLKRTCMSKSLLTQSAVKT
jgi:hypothetical protein